VHAVLCCTAYMWIQCDGKLVDCYKSQQLQVEQLFLHARNVFSCKKCTVMRLLQLLRTECCIIVVVHSVNWHDA
jgi:hypothetical protein